MRTLSKATLIALAAASALASAACNSIASADRGNAVQESKEGALKGRLWQAIK